MKKIISFIVLSVFTVNACSAQTAQTDLPNPSPTEQPIFTDQPVPTATETITPTSPAEEEGGAVSQEITNALASFYFDPDYLGEFAQINESTITIAGQEVRAIVGVDTDGSATPLMAEMTKLDGAREMVRISGYTDEAGVSRYVFMNPDLGVAPSGAFQLTEKAAELIWERFYQELSQGEFEGLSPEEVKAQFVAKAEAGEMVQLSVPTAHDNLTDSNRKLAEWERVTLDPRLPMEVIMVGSWEQLHALPVELQSEIPDPYPESGIIYEGLVTVAKDGHLVVIGVDTQYFQNFFGLNREGIEKGLERWDLTLPQLRRNGGLGVGHQLFRAINWLSEFKDQNAFRRQVGNSEGSQVFEAFTEPWWEAQASE